MQPPSPPFDSPEFMEVNQRLAREQFLLQALVDNIPEPVFFKDRQGRFIRVNRKMARDAGFSDPGDLVGKTDADIWSDEFARETLADERRLMETGEPIISKEEMPRKAGAPPRWVSVTKMPLRDDAGAVVGLFGVAWDITRHKEQAQATEKANAELQREIALRRRAERAALNIAQDADEARRAIEKTNAELQREVALRRQAEDNLRKAHAFLDSIIEHVPLHLFVKSADDLRYELLNKAGARLLGVRQEDIVGHTDYELFSGEQADFFVAKDREALNNKGLVDIPEESVQTPQGMRILHTRKIPILDAQGNSSHLLGIAEDITERKRAEEARARLAAIVESASDAIIGKDLNGIIVSWNPAAERLFGYRAADAIGQALVILSAPGSEDEEARILERIREGESIEPHETVRRRKDGSLVEVSLTVSPVKDRLGRVTGASQIIRDVTERRRAEDALRAAESRWRTLVETATDYITMIDRAGTILFLNRPPPGVLLEDVVGTSAFQLVPPEQHEIFRNSLEHVFRTGEPTSYEVPALLPRVDELHWYSTRMGPVKIEGRVQAVTSISTDITDRRRAEDQLKQLAVELARSNSELEQFAYIASHDLQEPLRKVHAFSDMLVSKYQAVLGDEGVDYLQRMQNASKRMQRLINDLLTFSRVTTKARAFAPVDLAKVAQQVVADLEIRIRQTSGQVEIGVLPVLEADATQMQQLLQNLIGNALKFHRPGVPPVVHVKASLTDEGIAQDQLPVQYSQICVQDNGIGFDEKYLDRIFAPFQRLHGIGAYEGSGIGLAICRKIVDRHGGTISATSTPGQGSVFLVTLPLRQPKAGGKK